MVSQESGGNPVQTGERRPERTIDGKAGWNLVIQSRLVRTLDAAPFIHQRDNPVARSLQALRQFLLASSLSDLTHRHF